MKQVLIHCDSILLDSIKELGLKYIESSNGEIDVTVSDVPYNVENGIYQDPDEQLCEHYGIDYDLVNCIEAVS